MRRSKCNVRIVSKFSAITFESFVCESMKYLPLFSYFDHSPKFGDFSNFQGPSFRLELFSIEQSLSMLNTDSPTQCNVNAFRTVNDFLFINLQVG